MDTIQDATLYYYSLMAFGVVLIVIAIWLFKLNENGVSHNEKIPRSLLLGMPIAIADLLWCIPHAKPLLDPSMHQYLLPTAIVCMVLTYFLLDYVFSRALGGFFILLAYYFLHESFTFHTAALPVFSFFCYLMGGVGLFFCGKPYLFRDLIRLMSQKQTWRYAVSGIVAAFAVLSMILSFKHLA